MKRFTVFHSLFMLLGLVLTAPVLAASTGLRPTIVIDRIPLIKIPEADWRFYKLPDGTTEAEDSKCTKAAKGANKLELVALKIGVKAGDLITLPENMGLVCVSATFKQTASGPQQEYWSGLFDFVVKPEEIVERDIRVRLYETAVEWGTLHGETLPNDVRYKISSLAKDIDRKPLFSFEGKGNRTSFLLPDQFCFEATSSHEFVAPHNKHLGEKPASAQLKGARNTECDAKASGKLEFALGRVTLKAFATDALLRTSPNGFYPFPLSYVFYSNTGSILKVPGEPIVVDADSGNERSILLPVEVYKLAVRYSPSRETEKGRQIQIPTIESFPVGKHVDFDPKPKKLDLKLGGVALIWKSNNDGSIEYRVYREEQELISGEPPTPSFFKLKTTKKKVELILPEGKYKIFSSVDGVSVADTVSVDVKKGMLNKTDPEEFQTNASLIRFNLTNVAGNRLYRPEAWRVHVDSLARSFEVPSRQANNGIWMAAGAYRVDVIWKNKTFSKAFTVKPLKNQDKPVERIIEVIDWDR